MKLSRAPRTVLRPFIELLWADDGCTASPSASGRELVLPTGAMHIVFRLGDHPLRLYEDAGDLAGETVGCAIIGGSRDRPYLRDVSRSGPSVGVLLRPGAAELMIGVPAGALAKRHTCLEDVWGQAAVAEIGERLSESDSLSGRLDILEHMLAGRLPHARGIDPLIANALARFGTIASIREVVQDCGYSHRHFTKQFRESVGLKPKTYCRLLRFGRALDHLAGEPEIGLAELAAAEGYADQAHLTREFRDFAGLSPRAYRRRATASRRHLPL